MLIFERGWSMDKDGPGQRRIYYLKGCNLRCLYCGNPESIRATPELLFYPERERAGRDAVCPYGALAGDTLDRTRCEVCRERPCFAVWHHPALQSVGEEIAPAAIVAEACRDRWLFGAEGGVTFGGGEPTLQAKELAATLDDLRAQGIHTAIESNASTEAYRAIASRTDLVISDCKAVTPELHRHLTGGDNAAILDNLSWAVGHHPHFLLRIVLIEGFTLTDGECDAYVRQLAEWQKVRTERFGEALRVQTLRFHHFGAGKYAALGRSEPLADFSVPSRKAQAAFNRRIAAVGIESVPSE